MKRALVLLACLPLVASCGPADDGDSRPFHLASSTLQAFPEGDPVFRLHPRSLSGDVDAVSIHQDFLGIPWTAFRDDQALPLPWVASIDALVRTAGRMPVFLSLALVGGDGRAYLDDAVSVDGLSKTSNWSAICFDFVRDPEGARLQRAYIDYAMWMIDRFHPRWLNLGIELNLYRESCDDRTWASLVQAEVAIYRAIKVRHPDLPIFPSLALEALHDPDAATFEANLQAIEGLEMDRLALSTYPFARSGVIDAADLPEDYFTRLSSRVEMPLVIAATGWPAEEIRYAQDQTTGPCVSHGMGSPAQQAAFLTRLAAEADAHHAELLTWGSNRDLLLPGLSGACSTIDREYECMDHPDWCELVVSSRGAGRDPAGELELKSRGTLGLRDYHGQAREPMATTWSELRARPLRGP